MSLLAYMRRTHSPVGVGVPGYPGTSNISYPSELTSFYWQLQGVIPTDRLEDVYDIDGFDNAKSVFDALKNNGKYVIAYFSAGTFESWRDDAGDYPSAIKGNDVDGWAGEKWVDVREVAILQSIMEARADIAVAKGAHAIEWDNLDIWQQSSGFPITQADTQVWLQMLADITHSRGLAAIFKNTPDLAVWASTRFDGCIAEEAYQWDEIATYMPWRNAGKPVWAIEYTGTLDCSDANSRGIYLAKYPVDLDGAPTATCQLSPGNNEDSYATYPVTPPTTSGTYYVATDGNDSNSGMSVGAPFATIAKALTVASSGDTILVRGGTYSVSSSFTCSGTPANPIRIMGYGTERPVIDATNLPSGSRLVNASGQRYHWKGFEWRNIKGGPVLVTGSFNKFEDIYIHDSCTVGDPGGAMYCYGAGATDNLFQDCVVWKLGDGTSTSTNTPDSFRATGGAGDLAARNVFVRCLSANAPDDGFDLFYGSQCSLIDCVSIGSGWYWNGNRAADGGGFKLGTNSAGVGNQVITGCIAAKHYNDGFGHNGAAESLTFSYNTAFSNNDIGIDAGNKAGTSVTYNIGYANGTANYAGVSGSNNTWNLGISNPQFVDASNGDFAVQPGSPAKGAGENGADLGASAAAIALCKKWWNHSQIWIDGRGVGTGGTGLPGDTGEPASGLIEGVGSSSSSLIDYPPTEPTTTGDYYVSSSGNDSNNGTSVLTPFKTLSKAITTASSGQTILVRAGTYNLTSAIDINKASLKVWNYGSERPIIDRGMGGTTTGENTYAVRITASGVHFKGFEIKGVPDRKKSDGTSDESPFAVRVTAGNAKIEDIVLHSGDTGDIRISTSDNTIIMDCVSIGNYGGGGGSNMPDGISVSKGTESNNVKVIRCLVANCGDDGIDFYGAKNSEIIDCVAIAIGRNNDNGGTLGDGNGFKMGGDSGSGSNTVRGSIAVYCSQQGLCHNSTPEPGNQFLNNTSAYNNYGLINDSGSTTSTVTNNIVLYNATYQHSSAGTRTYNTWNLGITNAGFVDVATGDFSLDVGSPCIGAGAAGVNLGASTVALELLKKWWNHSLIWVPGRGAGSGGTGLPGDTGAVSDETLGGVGSPSTSLVDYPQTAPIVTGDYYVATTGNDSNPGTFSQPFLTITKGLSMLSAGQTLLVRAGTYAVSNLTRSTTWASTTTIAGYGNEVPIINASGSTSSPRAGIYFSSSSRRERWIGFEIINAPMYGIRLEGKNTHLERIYIHHSCTEIYGAGLATMGNSAEDNLIQDCAVFRLGDGSSNHTDTPDGFVLSATDPDTTKRNKIVRCVAANCTDDGIDNYRAQYTEMIDCVVFMPGTYWNGVTYSSGVEGHGFKMGGGTGHHNTVKGSIVIDQKRVGLNANGADYATYLNNTVVNGGTGIAFRSGVTSAVAYNNLLVGNGSIYDTAQGGTPIPGTHPDIHHNSWTLDVTSSNVHFADPANGDFSLLSNSAAIGVGYNGATLGASTVALALAKKWWNHSQIRLNRGLGSGGTGLPGDS